MEKSKKLIFNHFYKLRHDLKRSFIISPEIIRNTNKKVHLGLISKIHPVYAMIFSFFSNPITLNDAIDQISAFLEISKSDVKDLIENLIERDDFSSCEYGGTNNVFPPNIIIDIKDVFIDTFQYTPSQFIYKELDFNQDRFYIAPIGIIFMVNNYCATNCVYCYADKGTKVNLLPFNRTKAIIKNAHDIGVNSFIITGGEIFLYEFWKELISELEKYNYKLPVLSTKLPLKETEINIIKEFNIPVQISLDSLNSRESVKILNTKKNYVENIKQSIVLIEQKGIRFQVATVLTKYNDNIETLEKIHDFLNNFKNITRWEIRVAFKSLYSRNDFEQIKISQESETQIGNWISNKKEKTNLNIQWSPSGGESRYFQSEGGSRNFIGPKCSANFSHMVILPDGKVTICEQLYWNPRFLIGDVSKQSIEEVWNSPRALKLAYPTKEDFRDESVCKKCKIFDECFSYSNKCFADVLKGYGNENWDFPDPRCKEAPAFIYDLIHH